MTVAREVAPGKLPALLAAKEKAMASGNWTPIIERKHNQKIATLRQTMDQSKRNLAAKLFEQAKKHIRTGIVSGKHWFFKGGTTTNDSFDYARQATLISYTLDIEHSDNSAFNDYAKMRVKVSYEEPYASPFVSVDGLANLFYSVPKTLNIAGKKRLTGLRNMTIGFDHRYPGFIAPRFSIIGYYGGVFWHFDLELDNKFHSHTCPRIRRNRPRYVVRQYVQAGRSFFAVVDTWINSDYVVAAFSPDKRDEAIARATEFESRYGTRSDWTERAFVENRVRKIPAPVEP